MVCPSLVYYHHLGPIDHRPGAPGLRVLEPLLILPALPRPGELLVEAIEFLIKIIAALALAEGINS